MSSSRISAVRERADAVAADLGDLDHRVERTHAAGGLELDVRRGSPPHQTKVVDGGASRAKASRGLDVVRAHVAADLAEANFLFVVQVAVLEDHLHDRSAVMRRLGHRGDVGRDSVPLAAHRLADVDDHVELGRPVGHGSLGFKDLHRRRMSAVREPDGRTHLHAGTLENPRGQGHGVGLDADAGHTVPRRQPTAFLELWQC